MGNSEVGHLNLGAGAVVQPGPHAHRRRGGRRLLLRRTRCSGEACDAAGASGRLHLLGLVSTGGVHSSMDHLQALHRAGRRARACRDVVLHAFTDGRDTAPDSGAGYVAEAEGWVREPAAAWPRSPAATSRWTATSAGTASSWPGTRSCTARPRRPHADSGEAAVRAAYERGETDEFIKPTARRRRGPHPRRRQRGASSTSGPIARGR